MPAIEEGIVLQLPQIDEYITSIKQNINADLPAFDYQVPEDCSPDQFDSTTDFEDSYMTRMVRGYVNDTITHFDATIDKAMRRVATELRKLDDNATQREVESICFFCVYSAWDAYFVPAVDRLAERNVDRLYSHFRKDTTPFDQGVQLSGETRGVSFFDVPAAVFDLLDTRAIEFLVNMDRFWLGKFISDPDTEKRVVTWMRNKMEQGGIPVGRKSPLIDEFIAEFATEMKNERWKVRRIIETTANRTRNMGNLFYMNQAQVKHFEVIELMDNKTCQYCKHMNKKRFDIPTTVDQFSELVKGGFDQVSSITPFATTIKITEFTAMDARALAAKGIKVPPFHPHCRGRMIAVFN